MILGTKPTSPIKSVQSKTHLRRSAKTLPTQAIIVLQATPPVSASVDTTPIQPKTTSKTRLPLRGSVELLPTLPIQPTKAKPLMRGSATNKPDEANATVQANISMSHPVIDEGGAEQATDRMQAMSVLSVLPALINAMRERHVHRQACIKTQIRIDNQCRSLVRRAMGWRMDAPEADRNRINRAAAKLVKLVQDGKLVPDEQTQIAEAIRPFCMAAMAAREHFDAYRERLEKQLESDAESLPVWEWAKKVRGFSGNLLSVIVGESGDLASYSGPRKLWKRLGLAPKEEYRMETKSGETALAVPRNRRAAIWVIGDCFIKQNRGKYREFYDQRKTYEKARAPDMSDMHAHRRAQRWMEKQFIKELWVAWCFGQMLCESTLTTGVTQ